MKRLIAILLMLPLLLNAQNESKYMEGAVPEVEGKVVFTRHLNVSDFNKEQIYNAMTDWISRTFTGSTSKIIISDPDNGTILAQNQNEIVARIGLFPAKVKMASIIKVACGDGYCMMETSRIRYTNNPSSEKPSDIIVAEEYITDKYAMNKTRTKIHKGIGDYRKGTIDIVDQNALDAQSAIYTYNNAAIANHNQTIANIPIPTTQAAHSAEAEQAYEPKAGANSNLEGNTPSTDIKIVQDTADGLKNGEYRALLIEVEGRPLPKPFAGEGALDLNTTQPAISFMLENDTDNIKFIMEMANKYTIAVCKNDDTQAENPLAIIYCEKTQQFDKLFIGTITDIRAK